ncbi:ATP-binding protein [Amycolatopsis sp. H20-H5]|uniref:ATP-binding protein n=1 Tax=Amycolatopsis sp. H20-H5 TaxID=3046309 RepID=UPI002DBB6050|nr:AAA family ATPase [Amycolatopsis sp. H20-H5]MEC3981178.1 AAA family ATPase [Amycolatopsis sp. H20-H5]
MTRERERTMMSNSVIEDQLGRTGIRRTSSPVLVGRTMELHALVSAAVRPPSVIMLDGEAGVGKTRLVNELLRRPELGGHRALVGHCQPLREPFPYGAVFEALGDLGDSLIGVPRLSPLTGVLRPYLPELAGFLPEPPPPLGDPRAERHRLFRAVRELLGALGPLLLVIEDLHWSDDGSRQLLRFLMAEPPDGLSLLLTYRREEVPGGIPLGAAHRPAAGTTSMLVELRPLDAEGVRSLATALLGDRPVSVEFAARLHERTAGIPFVIEETLYALRNPEGAVHADGATARRLLDNVEVPALLREATIERLTGLPLTARKITEAAAVLGVGSTAEMLAAVAGLPPARARQALVLALDRNVLIEGPDCHYGFRHALAQQAAYGTIPGPDRQELHRRAARLLAEGVPQALVRLAEHSRKAGNPVDAVRYGEAAADRAIAVGDLASATDLLSSLLTEPGLKPSAVDRLAIKLSGVACNGISQHDVRSTLENLLTDHRLSGRLSGEIRLSLGLLLIREAGGLEASRVEIELAVNDLADRPDLAGRGMAVLAQPWVGSTPLREHRRWLDRVDTLIDEATDQGLVLTLMANNIASRLHIGDPRAWTMLERVPARVTSVDQQRQLARLHCNVADSCAWIGHHRRAASMLHSGMQLAADCGAPYVVSTARATRVHVDWLSGHWDGLADRAHTLVEEYRDLLPVTSELALVLGLLAAARGEWDRAATHFAGTAVDQPENAFTPVVIAAHGGLAGMLLSQDEPEAAAVRADRGLDLLRGKGVWAWAGELVPAAVEAYCRTGRAARARELIAELEREISELDAPMSRAALSLCQGILAAKDVQFADAVKFLDDARARYERLPAPYHAALAAERVARCRLDSGESDAADAFSALAEVFDRLGATRDAARCRHAFRSTGAVAPSRRGRRGYGDELSPRERDVARLLSEGHTNREIAEVLFLSRRTVEQHVASVLRKLKVRSRGELLAG